MTPEELAKWLYEELEKRGLPQASMQWDDPMDSWSELNDRVRGGWIEVARLVMERAK